MWIQLLKYSTLIEPRFSFQLCVYLQLSTFNFQPSTRFIVPNGSVLIIGGNPGDTTIEVFNPN